MGKAGSDDATGDRELAMRSRTRTSTLDTPSLGIKTCPLRAR